MKNSLPTEEPLVIIERSALFIAFNVVISLLLGCFTYFLFKTVNPWGFLCMVPFVVMCSHTLWLILNPFAIIYPKRVEYKQSWLSNKVTYFTDIKKISRSDSGKLFITYTDNEQEALHLFGINSSHVALIQSSIEKQIVSGS